MAATGTPTPNIGLRIPLGTDPASVDDINYNSNLLDTKLGAVGSDSVQDQIDTLNGKLTGTNVTFTYSGGGQGSAICGLQIGKLCGVTCEVDATASTGSWATIGTLSAHPTKNITVPATRTGNGDYVGMVRITTTGSVDIYAKSALSANGIAFTAAFQTS